MCVEGQPDWVVDVDDGTMCLQCSPEPGPLCGWQKSAADRVQIKIQSDSQQHDAFSELLVLEWKDWLSFVSSVGLNSAAPINDILENLAPALLKLGLKGKAAIKVINGNQYVVIAGYAGLRKILTGTKYLPSNVKVADLVIGTAKLAKSAVKTTALSIVLVGAADVLEAVLDDKDWLSTEVELTVLSDMTKQTIGAVAGYVAAALLSVAGAPVCVPIAAGIVIALAVSSALDSYYPRTKLVEGIRDYYDNLMDQGGHLLQDFERALLWQVWPHGEVPFPY
jgi:hypothetical protein